MSPETPTTTSTTTTSSCSAPTACTPASQPRGGFSPPQAVVRKGLVVVIVSVIAVLQHQLLMRSDRASHGRHRPYSAHAPHGLHATQASPTGVKACLRVRRRHPELLMALQLLQLQWRHLLGPELVLLVCAVLLGLLVVRIQSSSVLVFRMKSSS